MFEMTDKVVIVTGGSRGMGREMCLAFAQRGADVVVASRKLDNCNALAEQIAQETGRRAVGFAYHAGKWDDSLRLADFVQKEFGRVDVLVNNAGMSPLYPSLTEISEDLFDKVASVNFKGPFRLSTIVAERMAAGTGGTIINVSSISSLEPQAGELEYGCVKAALNALTRGVARAFAPKVRCNAILPGPFATDIADGWVEGTRERIGTLVPLQRVGEAHEVVGAALYLASEASSYTTGALLKIDGGLCWAAA